VEWGGYATVVVPVKYTGRGGLMWDGAALVPRVSSYVGRGGVEFDGTAPAGTEMKYTGRGGLAYDGAARITPGLTHGTAGGVEWDGTAPVVLKTVALPHGGLAWGGAAALRVVIAEATSGGVEWGGTAGVAGKLPYTSKGGLAFDGTATFSFVSLPDMPGQWTKYPIDYTMFRNAATSQTINLRAMAAKEVLLCFAVQNVVTWQGGTVAGTGLNLGCNGGTGGGGVSNTLYLNNYGIHDAVSLTPYIPPAINGQMGDCQNLVNTWQVTCTLQTSGGNVSGLSQGQANIWLLTSLLP
jgi:hypothetical protein